ncbi:MAG: TIGR03905 family TSCPD domain-containing protein [Candidatus Coproplasma sp.]
MKSFKYVTSGTCSRQITFEVDDENKIHSVRFLGGCAGNTQGVSRLCEGRDIDEVHDLVKGVLCRNGTSCPDQLARAIEKYKAENL